MGPLYRQKAARLPPIRQAVVQGVGFPLFYILLRNTDAAPTLCALAILHHGVGFATSFYNRLQGVPGNFPYRWPTGYLTFAFGLAALTFLAVVIVQARI